MGIIGATHAANQAEWLKDILLEAKTKGPDVVKFVTEHFLNSYIR